ncbi:hypothetical protein O3P69_012314 [Scylla paramamosain]|uniref:Uncharacterized protein n=1 Tax=Scylla paramamosain TaxID=85552 RepID=A0AAW0TFF8_SCYPA
MSRRARRSRPPASLGASQARSPPRDTGAAAPRPSCPHCSANEPLSDARFRSRTPAATRSTAWGFLCTIEEKEAEEKKDKDKEKKEKENENKEKRQDIPGQARHLGLHTWLTYTVTWMDKQKTGSGEGEEGAPRYQASITLTSHDPAWERNVTGHGCRSRDS